MQKQRKNTLLLSTLAIGMLLSMSLVQLVQAERFYFPTYPAGVYGTDPPGNEGIIHIKLDTNANNIPDTWFETYCIDYDTVINWGDTYDATITDAPDAAPYTSVAFILSWWHQPGSYEAPSEVSPDNTPGYVPASGFSRDDARAVARAIWHHTDGLSVSGDALTIANDADNRDVVRSGDAFTLTLVSQSAGVATLKAKVGTRPGVMVLFSLSGATGTSLTAFTDPGVPDEWNVPTLVPALTHKGFTNAAGEIVFTVSYSESSPAPVVINAYSQGLWFKIVNSVKGTAHYQHLGTVGYGTSLVIKTAQISLHAVPEVALGTAMAVGLCFAGFAVFKKRFASPKPI